MGRVQVTLRVREPRRFFVPLRRCFVELISFGVPIALGMTDNDGRVRDHRGDLGMDVPFTGRATRRDPIRFTLRVLKHNSVIRLVNPLGFTEWQDMDLRYTGRTLTPIVPDNDRQLAVVNRHVEVYDRVFRHFSLFRRREFPFGRHSRSLHRMKDDESRIIELSYPYGLPVPPLSFVDPSEGPQGGMPRINLRRDDPRLWGRGGSRRVMASLIPAELSHGIHFGSLSQLARDDIKGRYARWIIWDFATGGGGTHNLGKETDTTVAFVEAIDHFVHRFDDFRIRWPNLQSSAINNAFIFEEINSGRFCTLSGGDMFRGRLTPIANRTGPEREGAIYGAMFIDLARRRSVGGLQGVFNAYFNSRATTFGEFRTWARRRHLGIARALPGVQRTWGL